MTPWRWKSKVESSTFRQEEDLKPGYHSRASGSMQRETAVDPALPDAALHAGPADRPGKHAARCFSELRRAQSAQWMPSPAGSEGNPQFTVYCGTASPAHQ